MKKLFAAVVAIVMMMSLSIAVFADSPTGTVLRKVTVINGIGATADVKQVNDGDSVSFTADSSKGKFDKWMVYKADGSAAVLGTDYTVANGSATDSAFSIVPKADLIVTGNYGGKITDPKTGKESTSPKTGDFTVLYFGIAALAALGCGVVSKKQLAK